VRITAPQITGTQKLRGCGAGAADMRKASSGAARYV
jgi:hypothetical protein